MGACSSKESWHWLEDVLTVCRATDFFFQLELPWNIKTCIHLVIMIWLNTLRNKYLSETQPKYLQVLCFQVTSLNVITNYYRPFFLPPILPSFLFLWTSIKYMEYPVYASILLVFEESPIQHNSVLTELVVWSVIQTCRLRITLKFKALPRNIFLRQLWIHKCRMPVVS